MLIPSRLTMHDRVHIKGRIATNLLQMGRQNPTEVMLDLENSSKTSEYWGKNKKFQQTTHTEVRSRNRPITLLLLSWTRERTIWNDHAQLQINDNTPITLHGLGIRQNTNVGLKQKLMVNLQTVGVRSLRLSYKVTKTAFGPLCRNRFWPFAWWYQTIYLPLHCTFNCDGERLLYRPTRLPKNCKLLNVCSMGSGRKYQDMFWIRSGLTLSYDFVSGILCRLSL